MRVTTWTGSRRAVAGAATLTLLSLSGCGLPLPFGDPAADAHATVTGVRQAVHRAGSVTVDFDVTFGPQYSRDGVHWEGTTRLRYGDHPASETEFTSFSIRGMAGLSEPGEFQLIDLHEIVEGTVRQESVRYHRSEELATPQDRPWARLDPGQILQYGPDIANPDLGVVDPEWYLALLASVNETAARGAVTDDREEIDGVTTDRYRLSCELADWECPYPQEGDPLLALFPDYRWVNLGFWLDGDGLPRRLEAEFILHTTSAFDGSTVAYTAEVEMTFRDFGAPAEITPPPADEVTSWPPEP